MDNSTQVVRTPIEDAYAIYRRMRGAGGYRKLNATDRQWYFFYRQHRNYTKYWRKFSRNQLLNHVPEAVEEAKDWLEKWTEFAEWFEGQTISEEAFGDVDGTNVYHYEGGGTGVMQRRDSYNSLVRNHSGFSERVWDKVNSVQEQLDLVDEDDPDFGVYEEVISKVTELGLEPVEAMNARDDGMLWFVDPETDVKYMYALRPLHSTTRWNNRPWTVTSTFTFDRQQSYSAHSNWKDHPYITLDRTIVRFVHRGFPDVMRIFSDYFGAFDLIKPYLDLKSSPVSFA